GAQDAHGRDVGPGEDGGGPAGPAEQLLPGLVAAFLRVARARDLDRVVQPVAAHGLPVAVTADLLGTARPLAPPGGRGVRDAPVTERDEMIDDERGAREVVVDDRVVLVGGVVVPD